MSEEIVETDHYESIKVISDKVHANALAKGWWDNGDRPPLEVHMLIVSEIAEATEEVRKGTSPLYFEGDTNKPAGELIELADAMIRIMDYCAQKGWDLGNAIKLKHEYNLTREYRHGGKKF